MTARRAKAPGTAKKRRQWARMKATTFIAAQLQDVSADLEDAREDRSWQAVRDLRRMVSQFYAELQTAKKQEEADRLEGGVPVDATDEDVFGLIEQAAEDMPDEDVDRLLEVLLERRPEYVQALVAADVI